MQAKFIDNFYRIQKAKDSNIGLIFQPIPERMPLPIRIYDDPFFPFAKAVITATREVVCSYMFDLASYLSIGAAGAIALERSIAYIGSDHLKILHGPFSGSGYAKMMEENAFNVDAVTLVEGENRAAYLHRSDRTAFIMRDKRPAENKLTGDLFIHSENVLLMETDTEKPLEIWLADASILYRSSQDDFADVIRQELIEFQKKVSG